MLDLFYYLRIFTINYFIKGFIPKKMPLALHYTISAKTCFQLSYY